MIKVMMTVILDDKYTESKIVDGMDIINRQMGYGESELDVVYSAISENLYRRQAKEEYGIDNIPPTELIVASDYDGNVIKTNIKRNKEIVTFDVRNSPPSSELLC